MIERETLEGVGAFVQYLTNDFQPVERKEDAQMIYVVFDDGRSMYLVPPAEMARREAAARNNRGGS